MAFNDFIPQTEFDFGLMKGKKTSKTVTKFRT